jgi:pimeloyl-ACP methyl ester carboxylesterase
MPTLTLDGVRLAYDDAGSGDPAMLLVHGILCDRSHLARQLAYFGRRQRCVAVDLRGHGDSDAPVQEYTIEGFADDLAVMCRRLGLGRPVVVGHSLGGIIALAFAVRHPDLVSGVVDLDSVLIPPGDRTDKLRTVLESFDGPDHVQAVGELFSALIGPYASPELREEILAGTRRVPRHVAGSTWRHAFFDFDTEAALARCSAPFLYLDAGTLNMDLERAGQICPRLTHGRTVGAGHFHQLEVPEQVNAMIERFVGLVAAGRDGSMAAGGRPAGP